MTAPRVMKHGTGAPHPLEVNRIDLLLDSLSYPRRSFNAYYDDQNALGEHE